MSINDISISDHSHNYLLEQKNVNLTIGIGQNKISTKFLRPSLFNIRGIFGKIGNYFETDFEKKPHLDVLLTPGQVLMPEPVPE